MQPDEMIRIYTCLCNLVRLRILGLLLDGPLCVCHLQQILGVPQPKVSRQLNLMRKHGLVTSEREFNWSTCRISHKQSPVLSSALKCLQDARNEMPVFRRDKAKRQRVIDQLVKTKSCCPAAVVLPQDSKGLTPGVPAPTGSNSSAEEKKTKNPTKTCTC
jgi:ArsR family transcriptional regulator